MSTPLTAPLVADSAPTIKWLQTAQARAAIAGHQLTQTPNGFMLSRWGLSRHCADPATVNELLERAILAEVTPGSRPFSGDSYLPDHLVKAAQAALDGIDLEVNQRAHNALSTAGWHIARGEPDKALARLRRAQAHILHSMTIGRA